MDEIQDVLVSEPKQEIPQPKVVEEKSKVKRKEGKRITGARKSNGKFYVTYRMDDGTIHKHELKKNEVIQDTIKI